MIPPELEGFVARPGDEQARRRAQEYAYWREVRKRITKLMQERTRTERALDYLQSRLATSESRRRERIVGIEDHIRSRTKEYQEEATRERLAAHAAQEAASVLTERWAQTLLRATRHFQLEHDMGLVEAAAAARELAGEKP